MLNLQWKYVRNCTKIWSSVDVFECNYGSFTETGYEVTNVLDTYFATNESLLSLLHRSTVKCFWSTSIHHLHYLMLSKVAQPLLPTTPSHYCSQGKLLMHQNILLFKTQLQTFRLSSSFDHNLLIIIIIIFKLYLNCI